MPAPETLATDHAHRVFAITEVLEHILSFVPPQGLLRCQRVNQRFRDVVKKPRVSEEALFYRPRNLRPHQRLYELNPLLVQRGYNVGKDIVLGTTAATSQR